MLEGRLAVAVVCACGKAMTGLNHCMTTEAPVKSVAHSDDSMMQAKS